MNYAAKWSATDVNKVTILRHLKTYGHLLKWKDYKETCLEVGCGEGVMTKEILLPYIEDHIAKLVAVDILDGMIQFAKERNAHEKIDYQIVDILNDQFITTMQSQFDHVFSLFVSHLIPDTRSFLTSFYKILKSGGQIFVITLVNSFFSQVFSELCKEKQLLNSKLESPFADYTANPAQHITELLEDIGFTVDLCEHEKRFVTTENFEGFVTALAEMYQNLEVIPSELLTVFYEEFLQKCREKCINLGEQEKYDIPTEVLVFIATKPS